MVTTGGREAHYSARGVNGPIEDLLFPIHHGILFYPGYAVLPPFVAYHTNRLDAAGFEALAEQLRERMRTLSTTAPLPFRTQNGGDYLIPSMTLRRTWARRAPRDLRCIWRMGARPRPA